MEREKFGSRLGFILVSAGCAVGLGNVWKFPYMCGQYGGAAFIAIYLVFLVILGYPIIVCEFAVGRGSQKSCATSFRKLEPKGRRWHYNGYIGMAGCYLLMMYYTMVTGWMLYYFFRYLTGSLTSQSMTTEQVSSYFSNMLASPGTMILFMIIAVVLSFAICSLGLKNGVERITKVMMICLLGLILVLAVHSCLLPGSGTGIRFYLVPDFTAMQAKGIGNVIFIIILNIPALFVDAYINMAYTAFYELATEKLVVVQPGSGIDPSNVVSANYTVDENPQQTAPVSRDIQAEEQNETTQREVKQSDAVVMSAQNEPETVVQTEVSEQNAETSSQFQETADDGVQNAQEAPQNVASSLETQATAAKEQEDAQAAKEAAKDAKEEARYLAEEQKYDDTERK